MRIALAMTKKPFSKWFMVIQTFKGTHTFIHLAQIKFNILKCSYYTYGNRLLVLKYQERENVNVYNCINLKV